MAAMFLRGLKFVLKTLVTIAVLVPVLAVLARLVTGLYARSLTHSLGEVPERSTAIIFGAGLWRDGSPTPVLRDRVEVGAQLYFAGKVKNLLMSGGVWSDRYNEPAAMRRYAISLGVPDAAIISDFSGNRTYDTCYRAKHIFGIREAILVTQSFHLPRAVYVCNALGVAAEGVASDIRQHRRGALAYWNLRELPATLAALWDVHISRPQLPLESAGDNIFMEAQ